jgi:hypothetical protein
MVAMLWNSPAAHSQKPHERLRRNLIRTLSFAGLRHRLRHRLRVRRNQVAPEQPLTIDQYGAAEQRRDHERRASEIREILHQSILGQGHAFVRKWGRGFAQSRRKISDLNHNPTTDR